MTIKAGKIVNNAGNVLLDGNTLSVTAESHGGHILQVKSYQFEGLHTRYKSEIDWDWTVMFATPPRDFVLSDIKNYVYVIVEVAYTNQNFFATGTGRWNHSIGRGYSTDLNWPGLNWPITSADPARFYQTVYYSKPTFSDGSIWENTYTKQFSTEYLSEMTGGTGNQNPGGGLNWYHAIDGHHYYPENRREASSDLWYWTFDYLDKSPQHISNFSYAMMTRPHSNNYALPHLLSYERGQRITLIEIGEQSTNNPKRNTPLQQSSEDRSRLNKIIGGVSACTISASVGSWNTFFTPSGYTKVNIPHSSTPTIGDRAIDLQISNITSGLIRTVRLYKDNVLIHTFEMDIGVQDVFLQDADNINFNTTYQYKVEVEAKLYNNSGADATTNVTTPSTYLSLAANTLSTTNHYLEYTDSTKKQSLIIEFDDVGPWYDVSRYIWNLYNPGPAGKINIGRPGTSLLAAQANGQYFYLNRPEGAGSQTHTDLEISYNTVPSVGNLNYNGRIKIVYDNTLSSFGKYRLFIDELADGVDQTNAQSGVYAAYGDPTAITTGIVKPYYGNGTPYQFDSANGFLRHMVSFSTDTINNNQQGLETKDSNGNVVSQIFSIQPDLAHSDGPSGNNPATITTGYWGDGTVFPTTETMTGSFSWTTPIAGVHTTPNGLPTVSWNVNLPSTSGIQFDVSIYNPDDPNLSSNSNFSLTALEVDIANSWEPFATDSIAAKDPVYTTFSITDLLLRGAGNVGHVRPGDTVRIKAKFFYVAEGHDLPKLNSAYNGQVYNIWQLGKHSEPEWSKTVDITIPEFVTVTDKKYYHTFEWENFENASNVTEYRVYYNDVNNVIWEQGGSRLAGVYGEAGTARYKTITKKANVEAGKDYSVSIANVAHGEGIFGHRAGGIGLTSSAGDQTYDYFAIQPAIDMVLNGIRDHVVDSNGNIFVMTANRIQKMVLQADGTYNIHPWAGYWDANYNGYADGYGTLAEFKDISRAWIDSNDNIYLTETGNVAIRKIVDGGLTETVGGVTYNIGTVSTFAGGPTMTDFGTPSAPQLKGITGDSNGDIFVVSGSGSDKDVKRVRVTQQYGIQIYNFSGGNPTSGANNTGTDGTGHYSDTGANTNAPHYLEPTDITIDSNDNLYLADKHNRIVKITPAGVATTLTGTYSSATAGNVVGTLSQARFTQIECVWYDTTNNLLYVGDANGIKVVDEANNSVQHVTQAGSEHFHYMGSGSNEPRMVKGNSNFQTSSGVDGFGTFIQKYTSVPEDYFLNVGDLGIPQSKTKIYSYWDGNNVPKNSGSSTVTVRKHFGFAANTSYGICPIQIEEIPVVLNPNLNSSSTYTVDEITVFPVSQKFSGAYSYFDFEWDTSTVTGLTYVVIETTAPSAKAKTIRVPPFLGRYKDWYGPGTITDGDTYTFDIYGERWCSPTGQSGETWDSMRTKKTHATVTTKSVLNVSDGGPNTNFTFTIEKVGVSYVVRFTDTSATINPDASITQWSWTFGDGTTSTDQNPTKTYSEPLSSSYSVSLTVTQDHTSLTGSITKTVPMLVDFEIVLIGGGGSGAHGNSSAQGVGGGGGAGGVNFRSGSNKHSVRIGQDVNILVGAPGLVPTAGSDGNAGHNTSIFVSGTGAFEQYATGGGGGGDGSSSSTVDGGDARPTPTNPVQPAVRGGGGGGGMLANPTTYGNGGAGLASGAQGSTHGSGHGAGSAGTVAESSSKPLGPGVNIGLQATNDDQIFSTTVTDVVAQGGRGQLNPNVGSAITTDITGYGSGGYGGTPSTGPSQGKGGAAIIKVPSGTTLTFSTNTGTGNVIEDKGNYTLNGVTYDFYTFDSHTGSGNVTIFYTVKLYNEFKY